MFALPLYVISRRGVKIYYSTPGLLCFYLCYFGIHDGTFVHSPPTGTKLYLEVSTDLLPIGTTMESAIAIMNAYLAGEDITQEDIDMFKMVFPNWAPNTYYDLNEGVSYGMVPYQAIAPMTSQEGDIPPDYPELYKLPLTYIAP